MQKAAAVKASKEQQKLMPLPEELRCSLAWKDLTYSIPLSSDERKSDIKSGMTGE